jgi:hypothetical protein
MTAHVLTGSKQQIAAQLARLEGQVREAIVFVDDVAGQSPAEDMFAEMEAFTVRQAEVDDSRASVYRRLEGE